MRHHTVTDNLKRLIDALGNAPNDKVTFFSLLSQAITLLDISDEDIAERFEASHPTIIRWRTGHGAPHGELRLSVYEWLAGLARTRLVTELYTPRQWERLYPAPMPHCDLCNRDALWKHPAGGYRCDTCPRPLEAAK